MNGDIFISKIYFAKMINQKKSCTYGIKRKKYKDGEMNIITKKNYIKEISKKINPKSSNAESAQISYFTKKDTKLLFQEVDSLINKNLLNLFPASAYSRLIKNSKMIIKFVNPLHWFEIDNKKDLRKIRKKINTQKKLELFKEYKLK